MSLLGWLRVLISIHALLAESDYKKRTKNIACSVFLSTLSLRRATALLNAQNRHLAFLSTLSLRRATQSSAKSTPAEEYFYPRSPCGERRGPFKRDQPQNVHFYPRSPCGERPVMDNIVLMPGEFLSTLSLRRATAKVHKTMGHFCTYETNFMGIASSC